jgi:hypothetical protein
MRNLEGTIRGAIQRVNAEVREHPLAFLTESDLQCQLYAGLLPAYGRLEPVSNTFIWGTAQPRTPKPLQSMRLHSELLLPEGRIDLAILDLRATRFAFSSKGHFGYAQLQPGSHAFIEIKVSRTHRSSIGKARWLRLLRADLDKLRRYPWLSFLLAYDFDFQLPPAEIRALSRMAGPRTRFLYLKDVFGCCYLEEEPPNNRMQWPSARNGPLALR